MLDSQSWLMLLNSVTGENKTARMRIWRALKASGAGTVRDGVYLLPLSDTARQVFEEQTAEVAAAGGSAHILAFHTTDPLQQEGFVALFDRSDDYAALLGRLNVFRAGI